MNITKGALLRLLALLAVFGLVAAACGGSSDAADDTAVDDTAADDGAEDTAAEDTAVDDTAADDTATDDEAAAEDDAAMEEDEAMADAGPIKMAIVAPSAQDDLAFTQSMIDSIAASDAEIELSISDGLFVVEDAAAAIRGYAEDGQEVIIVHGTQFGASLIEIAPDFPETTFVWGTASDTQGLDNVFAYYPTAEEGGYVNGVMAAMLSSSGTIGVVGPVEAGDAVAYINGFVEGAEATSDVTVAVTYTGSFSDVALAAEAAQAHLTNGVDILTGTSQSVVGAVGVATENDVPWFGTQANQTPLSPGLVVASQVYHWEFVLDEILALRASGVLGGEIFEINLANGGLVIEFNDGYALPDDVRAAGEAAIAAIADGSIDPVG